MTYPCPKFNSSAKPSLNLGMDKKLNSIETY